MYTSIYDWLYTSIYILVKSVRCPPDSFATPQTSLLTHLGNFCDFAKLGPLGPTFSPGMSIFSVHTSKEVLYHY